MVYYGSTFYLLISVTCRKTFRRSESAMKYIQEKFKSLSNGIWDFAIFKTFPNMAKEDNTPLPLLFFFSSQQYLAIQISPDQVMSFGGSTAPCAMCFLYSIGKIGEQENKVYSKLLCDLLNKQLKIPSDR